MSRIEVHIGWELSGGNAVTIAYAHDINLLECSLGSSQKYRVRSADVAHPDMKSSKSTAHSKLRYLTVITKSKEEALTLYPQRKTYAARTF